MKQAVNTEKTVSTLPGLLMLPILLIAGGAFLRWAIIAFQAQNHPTGLLFILGAFLSFFFLSGLFVVNPNEARVLQLFGDYVGTFT